MLDRRKFIKAGLATMATLMVSPTLLAKKLGVKLSQFPKLKKVGGSEIAKLNGKNVLLIKSGKSEIKAVSPVCTHQGCIVEYKHKTKNLVCPCHGATYNLNGKVLKGPAADPLLKYPVTIKGDILVIDTSPKK